MNRLWLAAPLTVVAIALAACSGTATQSSAPLPDSVTSDTAVGSVTEGSVPAEDRGTNAPAPADRDVIRTATLTVVVPDAEPAVARLQQLATTSDGYLESVRTGPTPVPCAEGEPCPTIGIPEEAQGGVTTVVLRVPATDYDAALAQVRTLGDVVGLDVSADDVTTQVTDLAARIRAQRESVIRVRQLMKQASSLAEVVQIEQERTQSITPHRADTMGEDKPPLRSFDRRTAVAELDEFPGECRAGDQLLGVPEVGLIGIHQINVFVILP